MINNDGISLNLKLYGTCQSITPFAAFIVQQIKPLDVVKRIKIGKARQSKGGKCLVKTHHIDTGLKLFLRDEKHIQSLYVYTSEPDIVAAVIEKTRLKTVPKENTPPVLCKKKKRGNYFRLDRMKHKTSISLKKQQIKEQNDELSPFGLALKNALNNRG